MLVVVAVLLALACGGTQARAAVSDVTPRHFGWQNLFQGHVGGHGPHLSWHFSINGHCDAAKTCCQYPKWSLAFTACCKLHGCCPRCEPSCEGGCRKSYWCEKSGGVCRRDGCEADERRHSWLCWGRRCHCCIRDEVEVTTDCEGNDECCQFEAGTGDFYNCCKKYNCCPVCTTPGCTDGNTTYASGEIVKSYPERCLQLQCEVTTLDTAPFYQSSLVEVSPTNSTCGCCELGGQLYEDGYLLTQDDYCLAIQCVEGQWVNQGFFNADCRTCTLQDPFVSVSSYDGTTVTVEDDVCTYSATQVGNSEDPDSYVYIDFETADTGFEHGTMTFKDEGADPITCDVDASTCSFGTFTTDPTEVTDQGTLALTMTLGIPFNFILGTNKIMTMYNDDTIIIWAPASLQDQLGGLCGEYNGDSSDNLSLRDDTTTTDVATFIENWKAPTDCTSRSVRSGSTDNCGSVSSADQSSFATSCSNMMGNVTDEMIQDECVQLMCVCSSTSESDCATVVGKTVQTWLDMKEKEKTPKELAQMFQGYTGD